MGSFEVWAGIILIIFIVLIMMKIISKKQAAAVKLAIALFIFLMITAGYVSVTKNVDLTTADGIKEAGKVYVSWLGAIFKNLGKVTTFAFKQDWSIESATNNITIAEEP